jgi:hypothetical protein
MSALKSPQYFYKASRRKAITGILIAMAFIWVGWVLIHGTGTSRTPAEVQHAVGWALMLLMGATLPFFVMWAFRPALLTFDAAGFQIKHPWAAARHYPWTEIDRVWALHTGKYSWVVWSYCDRSRAPKPEAATGYDGCLKGAWTFSADEVANELNRVRRSADKTE